MASHGRYTILGKLADGGMAEIFLAIQHGAEGFEKQVVLKRILTQYSADPQFRNMLLDEAHISMTLQHGSIVQVLDLGVAAGRYFLALELVDGWDLEKILQRAYKATMVFPTALGLYVVAEVCRALAYAHGKSRDGKPLGIVHRDISPNNVLLSGEGEVKLADFGIAKAQRKREQTAAGVIKGKVAYMSPEQARGEAIDRRSDIFSVGSLMYRMMTDRLPFEANNDLESLMRVQKAEFPPPQEAKPGIGSSVAAIIRRAMRLHPAERYQTADEMLIEVERVLRTEFHSAGQTELKSWLVQLGRRDNAPSIGRAPRDETGVVKDMVQTDLSIGTSFELGDLEQSSDQTELQRGRTPSPEPKPFPGGSLREPPPLPRSGHTAEIAKPGANVPSRGRSGGFWFGVILTLGTIYVVFFAESFIGPFQSFLITLGVPLAAWAGIMIADIALRQRDYDDEDLFDARGRYGAFDWVSIGTMVVASVLGWGLVVNSFATDAAWNNWQGYLLEPLGLGTYVTTGPDAPYWDGNWAYSNIGVLLALVLGFVVTYLARRGRVRRQEAGAPTVARSAADREPAR